MTEKPTGLPFGSEPQAEHIVVEDHPNSEKMIVFENNADNTLKKTNYFNTDLGLSNAIYVSWVNGTARILLPKKSEEQCKNEIKDAFKAEVDISGRYIRFWLYDEKEDPFLIAIDQELSDNTQSCENKTNSTVHIYGETLGLLKEVPLKILFKVLII